MYVNRQTRRKEPAWALLISKNSEVYRLKNLNNPSIYSIRLECSLLDLLRTAGCANSKRCVHLQLHQDRPVAHSFCLKQECCCFLTHSVAHVVYRVESAIFQGGARTQKLLNTLPRVNNKHMARESARSEYLIRPGQSRRQSIAGNISLALWKRNWSL